MEKAQASTHDMQRPVVLAAASAFYQAVDFFNWESGAHIGTLTGLIAQPHELASDNDNRRLFLTHTYRSGAYETGAEPGHEISIIDVDSQSLADVIDIHPFIAPHGVQYNKATALLFASVEKSDAGNGVIIIDPQSRTVLDHIPTPAENSHWVAVTKAGDRCFVTHKEAPSSRCSTYRNVASSTRLHYRAEPRRSTRLATTASPTPPPRTRLKGTMRQVHSPIRARLTTTGLDDCDR